MQTEKRCEADRGAREGRGLGAGRGAPTPLPPIDPPAPRCGGSSNFFHTTFTLKRSISLVLQQGRLALPAVAEFVKMAANVGDL